MATITWQCPEGHEEIRPSADVGDERAHLEALRDLIEAYKAGKTMYMCPVHHKKMMPVRIKP